MVKDRSAAGAVEFRAARDLLLEHRLDQPTAHRLFTWPRPESFNWAFDHFDVVAETRPDRTALWIVGEQGENKYTYQHLSLRSNQVANWLHSQGVHPGDRILVLLGDQVELWELLLAAIKLGVVVSPAPPSLSESELVDRLDRGDISHVVCAAPEAEKLTHLQGHWTRICVGYMEGWLSYPDSEYAGLEFHPPHPTGVDDPLLLYFTAGTTSVPKLVTHTQSSYPIGHLSTMYWLGLRPGDVHLNSASPGWAKHAYSSVFAPWNAEATVLVVSQYQFDPKRLLDELSDRGVDTFCAPPTVWRLFLQQDLASWRVGLREAVATGEPLNPDVVDQVRRAWDLTVRDGFGQTETTMLIGNGPGQVVLPGSMGGPLPGYDIELVDTVTDEPVPDGTPGEICVDLAPDPVGLMKGYSDDPDLSRQTSRGRRYRTGDIATREQDGNITYIGRVDDVFKSSDYRVSPFEIESVLAEHEYVVEAAVVPSPDPMRMSVVKAFVSLAEGAPAEAGTARAIMKYAEGRLAPYKRVRRVEFTDLPRTASGKIRRVTLRRAETGRGTVTDGSRNPHEFWEEDFAD